MDKHIGVALLALALTGAPAFAQDREPRSPHPPTPNSASPGPQQPSPREEVRRNCEKLTATQRDNCIRDFQPRTVRGPSLQAQLDSSNRPTGTRMVAEQLCVE